MVVTVVIVVPGMMVVAVMIVGVMIVAAVIIAVSPAPSLGLLRDEYASEKECYECSNDDFHGGYLAGMGKCSGVAFWYRQWPSFRRLGNYLWAWGGGAGCGGSFRAACRSLEDLIEPADSNFAVGPGTGGERVRVERVDLTHGTPKAEGHGGSRITSVVVSVVAGPIVERRVVAVSVVGRFL